MNPNLVPGILFRIDEVNSLRLHAWVQEMDWQVIAYQIEKRGAAFILDTQPNQGELSIRLGTLREIPPTRGRFRPHYSDAGGGFGYYFRPQAEGIALTGRCLIKSAYGGENLVPLELQLPNAVEFQTEAVHRTGLINVHDSQFTEGENQFGFYGEFYEIFRNWAWYSQAATGFEFQFFPFSIGCMMHVLHLESGTLLDLTKDVAW